MLRWDGLLLRQPSFSREVGPRDLASLVLAAVCWGLGTVISKAALVEFPPATLLTIQLAASLVVLTAIMAVRASRYEAGVHGCSAVWAS
jgi:drug/metabolite transporter (DMT)-like permease